MAQVMEGRYLCRSEYRENLVSGAGLRSKTDIAHDLNEFYERFPILGQRRNQAAGFLSGGEQQMLAIARALMSDQRSSCSMNHH